MIKNKGKHIHKLFYLFISMFIDYQIPPMNIGAKIAQDEYGAKNAQHVYRGKKHSA